MPGELLCQGPYMVLKQNVLPCIKHIKAFEVELVEQDLWSPCLIGVDVLNGVWATAC